MPLEPASVVWHDTFPFGNRVCLSAAEKQAVGEYVIQNHIDPHSVVFMSDGSSTFHMALRLFRSPLQLNLLTTNVAIAVERAVREHDEAVRQLEVDLAGGIVDSELLMVRGDTTEETVRGWGNKADVLIVSMRSYSRKTGPTERHPPSQRQISMACHEAIEASKKIIIISDHAKMSRTVDKTHDKPIFSTGKKWEVAAETGFIWFVTNRPPNPELGDDDAWMCPKAIQDRVLKQFINNSKYLHGLLGEQYIELPFSHVTKVSNE